VSEGWQDFGLWVGFGLGTLFLIGLCLHAIKDWRGSKKVEPLDVVMLGLGGMVISAALTLGGLIWQNSSAKTPESAQPVTQTEPAQTAVYAPAPQKPIPHYSPGDRDRISDALSEISGIMNQGVMPLFEKGHSVSLGWGKEKTIGATIAGLKEMRPMIYSLNNELDVLRNQKYVIYRDLLNDVLRINPEAQLSKVLTRGMDFEQSLETAQSIFNAAPQLKEQIVKMVHPADSFFAHANNELKPWVQDVNKRIGATKAAILRADKS